MLRLLPYWAEIFLSYLANLLLSWITCFLKFTLSVLYHALLAQLVESVTPAAVNRGLVLGHSHVHQWGVEITMVCVVH